GARAAPWTCHRARSDARHAPDRRTARADKVHSACVPPPKNEERFTKNGGWGGVRNGGPGAVRRGGRAPRTLRLSTTARPRRPQRIPEGEKGGAPDQVTSRCDESSGALANLCAPADTPGASAPRRRGGRRARAWPRRAGPRPQGRARCAREGTARNRDRWPRPKGRRGGSSRRRHEMTKAEARRERAPAPCP